MEIFLFFLFSRSSPFYLSHTGCVVTPGFTVKVEWKRDPVTKVISLVTHSLLLYMYLPCLMTSWWALQGKSPEAVRAAAYFTSWTPRRNRSWIGGVTCSALMRRSSPLHPDMMSPVLTLTCRRSPSQPLRFHRYSSSWCCRTHFIATRQLFSSSAVWIHMCLCEHPVSPRICTPVCLYCSCCSRCLCVAGEKWKRQRRANREVTQRLYSIASLSICHLWKEKNSPCWGHFFPPPTRN